jgi:hypothetical protein
VRWTAVVLGGILEGLPVFWVTDGPVGFGDKVNRTIDHGGRGLARGRLAAFAICAQCRFVDSVVLPT